MDEQTYESLIMSLHNMNDVTGMRNLLKHMKRKAVVVQSSEGISMYEKVIEKHIKDGEDDEAVKVFIYLVPVWYRSLWPAAVFWHDQRICGLDFLNTNRTIE